MSADRIGIDLGGTKIFGARIDTSADGASSMLARTKRPTPTTGVDGLVDALVEVVAELSDTPVSVGIGTPGVVVPGSGIVHSAPNLVGFDGPVDLGARLTQRLGCPVVLGNDVNVAALGEARAGAAQGDQDVLAIWMGTGLGAALVLDGSLRVGPGGRAGELGHVTLVPGGRVCGCGGRGHLEAYIGRRSLEREARRRQAAGEPTELVEIAADRPMKSKVFRRALDQGDELARELIEEGLDLLGIAIANVVVTVDVTSVVLGGGLGERLGDIAVPRLEAAMADMEIPGEPPRIRLAQLGDLAGALGAAHLANDASSV